MKLKRQQLALGYEGALTGSSKGGEYPRMRPSNDVGRSFKNGTRRVCMCCAQSGRGWGRFG